MSGRGLFENDDRSSMERIAEYTSEGECRSVTRTREPIFGQKFAA